jgi:hypothetical protein
VKQTNGSWLLTETTNVNDTVLIESLGEEVPLSEVYFEVDFS